MLYWILGIAIAVGFIAWRLAAGRRRGAGVIDMKLDQLPPGSLEKPGPRPVPDEELGDGTHGR